MNSSFHQCACGCEDGRRLIFLTANLNMEYMWDDDCLLRGSGADDFYTDEEMEYLEQEINN